MIFGVLCILSSCNKDSSWEQEKIDSNTMVEQFNEGKFPVDQGRVINGVIDVVSTKAEVLVFANLGTDTPVMFTLQTNKLNDLEPLNLHLEKGEILFLKRNLIIQGEDFTKLLFHIDATLPTSLNELQFTQKIKGYGLSLQENFELEYQRWSDFQQLNSVYDVYRTRGHRSSAGPTIVAADVNCKCCNDYHSGSSACEQIANDDCDAGGLGASSCSLSSEGDSCNVTCSYGTPCCWKAIVDSGNDDGDEETPE